MFENSKNDIVSIVGSCLRLPVFSFPVSADIHRKLPRALKFGFLDFEM